MPLFWTELILLYCSDVDAAKRWWIESFESKQVKVPENWDDSSPSDVALKLPGSPEPTILLREKGAAGSEALTTRPILFTSKVKKAHEQLLERGAAPGPIQDGGGTQFFEVRDLEGNVIEICKEP